MNYDLTLSRVFAFVVGLAALVVVLLTTGCGPLASGLGATLAPSLGIGSSTAGECPPDCCQPDCTSSGH